MTPSPNPSPSPSPSIPSPSILRQSAERRETHKRDYWQVSDDLAIGATEKAACTSIGFALNRCRRLNREQLAQRKLRVRLYLRHPIKRFASAFAYFAPNNNFPIQVSRPSDLVRKMPTLEQFTDAVLAGMWNEHWGPQLPQHCPIDELHRLEDIDATWPIDLKSVRELTHQNVGRIAKPDITYRLGDLEDYYREDLEAWSQA